MAKGSNDPVLQDAFRGHLKETEAQVQRLDQIAGILEIKLSGKFKGCLHSTLMGTLRYSLLIVLFCASCITILLFIVLSSVFVVVWPSHVGMTTCTVVLELGFCVGLSGNRRWLGGNAP